MKDGGEVEEEFHAGHGLTQADALSCEKRAGQEDHSHFTEVREAWGVF